jgi:acyl-CoA thioester hydrolase
LIDQKEIDSAFIQLELPVLWGNMDAAQHVNNTVYLRWVESARTEMFMKLNNGNFMKESVVPILAWQDCKYIFPVTYPDQVIITNNVVKLLEDRVLCEAKIYSKKHQRIVAISNTTLMGYNMKLQKKVSFLEKWKEILLDFYGTSILKN